MHISKQITHIVKYTIHVKHIHTHGVWSGNCKCSAADLCVPVTDDGIKIITDRKYGNAKHLKNHLWVQKGFAVKELAFLCLKRSFTATSGTLCTAACCHSASTSASGPVVLPQLTVREAVTLLSGGTHHSTGPGLDIEEIFQPDTFKSYSNHILNYIGVYYPFVFCRHCDLKRDIITNTNLLPFFY